jgi:hypothetical protein
MIVTDVKESSRICRIKGTLRFETREVGLKERSSPCRVKHSTRLERKENEDRKRVDKIES